MNDSTYIIVPVFHLQKMHYYRLEILTTHLLYIRIFLLKYIKRVVLPLRLYIKVKKNDQLRHKKENCTINFNQFYTRKRHTAINCNKNNLKRVLLFPEDS